jgi:hypothetical protein
LNYIVYDNIERLRSKNRYDFIWKAYQEIIDNRTDTDY